MATAFDVAHFLIAEENRRGQGAMTNLRLNKLLYFAQVISLLETEQPLFPDEFYAWQLGPVIPDINRHYKKYENRAIPTPEKMDYTVFTVEEIRFLFDVSEFLKKHSTSALIDLSHVKGGPWQVAIQKRMNSMVQKSDMLNYYRLKNEGRSFPRKSDQLIANIPNAERFNCEHNASLVAPIE